MKNNNETRTFFWEKKKNKQQLSVSKYLLQINYFPDFLIPPEANKILNLN